MHDQVLDRTVWGAGEVERKLDLPAVIGRQLRHDDKAGDGAVLRDAVVVLAMGYILPWVNVCQVDLFAFTAVQPVLDALVDFLPDLHARRCAEWDVVDLDAFLFRVADLALQVGVVHRRVVAGIETLLGSDGEGPPVELGRQDFLDWSTNQ